MKGIKLQEHPNRTGAHMLIIRKAEATWPAAAAWNFSMEARGWIRVRLMAESGFDGASIGITDHYSVPYVGEDVFQNVYNCPMGAKRAGAGRNA